MNIKYVVTGLDCPNCAAKLAKKIEEKEGITSCKINFLTEKMTLESDLPEDKAYEIALGECRAFSRDIKLEK